MASDSFTRANETPLASPWASDSVLGGIDLVSNTVGNNGGAADGLSYRTDSTALESQVTVAMPGGQDGGPAICCDGSGNGYVANCNTGTLIQIYKLTGGSFGLLNSGSGSYVTGHQIKIRRSGNDLIVSDNGTDVVTATDTSYMTGRPGIHCFDATIRFDDWTDNVASDTLFGQVLT